MSEALDLDDGYLPFEIPEAAWRRRRCPVCRGNLNDGRQFETTVTYAMQRQGWVKIGKSHQPEVRRKVMSMPSPGCRVLCPAAMTWAEPLILLGVWPGDIEHELHRRFAADHAAGEWFLPGAELREYLSTTLTSVML